MNWVQVYNNCGIGASGFQPGNTCAKEDGKASPPKKEEGGGLFGAMIGKLSEKMNKPKAAQESAEESPKKDTSIPQTLSDVSKVTSALGISSPISSDSSGDFVAIVRGNKAEEKAKAIAHTASLNGFKTTSSKSKGAFWPASIIFGSSGEYELEHREGHKAVVSWSTNDEVLQVKGKYADQDTTNLLLGPSQAVVFAAKYHLNQTIARLAGIGLKHAKNMDWEKAKQTYLGGINEVEKETRFGRITRRVKAGLKLVGMLFREIYHSIKEKIKSVGSWIKSTLGFNKSWTVVDNNCGTGKGGFKPGNTCASGGEVAEDVKELADKLAPGARYSVHPQFKNNASMNYRNMNRVEANLRRLEVEARLHELGFTQQFIRSNTGGSVVWEHPQGHEVDVVPGFQLGSSTRFLGVHIIHAAKADREGIQISRDARDATNKAVALVMAWGNNDREMNSGYAVSDALIGDYRHARHSHEAAVEYLVALDKGHGRLKPDDPKRVALRKAADLHRIARDWYMERMGVQNKYRPVDNADCGTGAGGFKKGNTCASGKEVAADVGELAGRLKLPGTPYVHMDNDQSMTYTLRGAQGNEVKTALNKIKKQASLAGFKIASRYDSRGEAGDRNQIVLEHQHGHLLNIVFQNPGPYQEGRLSAYLYFIPKEDREGLALTKEARDATATAFKDVITHLDMEAEAAVDDSRGRDYAGARKLHEKMIRAHTQKAGEIQLARETLGKGKTYTVDLVKLHKDAAAAHGIARDWYMERMGVQNHWQPIGV